MQSPIDGLNKDFENRIKLGIMSILCANDKMEFKELKSLLQVTDGNLSTHLSNLESKGYIISDKVIVLKKVKSIYKVTSNGRNAFSNHIDALEKLINFK